MLIPLCSFDDGKTKIALWTEDGGFVLRRTVANELGLYLRHFGTFKEARSAFVEEIEKVDYPTIRSRHR